MRTEAEVMERLKGLWRAALKERLERLLSVSFLNCRHNTRHRIPGSGQVGFCHCDALLEASRRRVIPCNDNDTARRCRHYCPLHTEQSVRAEFDAAIRDPARCGQEHPKLAALIWVLQKPSAPLMEAAQEFAQQLITSLSHKKVRHAADKLPRAVDLPDAKKEPQAPGSGDSTGVPG